MAGDNPDREVPPGVWWEQERLVSELVACGFPATTAKLLILAGYFPGDVAEAVRYGVDLRWYTLARRAGAAHATIVEVADLGVDQYWYARARHSGVTHAEMVEVFLEGDVDPVVVVGSGRWGL